MARSLSVSHSRKSQRIASDEDAVIVLADGATRVKCKIIDRSDGGAQIKIDRSVELPDEFRLIAGKPEVHAICQTAWRVGSRIGCSFVAQFRDHDPDGEVAALDDDGGDQKAIKSRLLKRPLIID